MTVVVVVVVVIIIIGVALVVVAPRMGGTRLGGLGRSRRPLGADDAGEPRGRTRHHRGSERRLHAESEKIAQRVEAQVARDRASTLRRWQEKGQAETSRLAPGSNPPVVPGYEPAGYGMAEVGHAEAG